MQICALLFSPELLVVWWKVAQCWLRMVAGLVVHKSAKLFRVKALVKLGTSMHALFAAWLSEARKAMHLTVWQRQVRNY